MAKGTRAELGQIVIRPPEGMRERIKALADRDGRSMNALIVRALERWLDDEDYYEGLVRHYTENPPEMPPDDWRGEDWEPPSDDFLLNEEQRQFAKKLGAETARQILEALHGAGIELKPRRPIKTKD